MKKRFAGNMKRKVLSFVGIYFFSLVLILSGCSGSSDAADKTSDSSTNSTSQNATSESSASEKNEPVKRVSKVPFNGVWENQAGEKLYIKAADIWREYPDTGNSVGWVAPFGQIDQESKMISVNDSEKQAVSLEDETLSFFDASSQKDENFTKAEDTYNLLEETPLNGEWEPANMVEGDNRGNMHINVTEVTFDNLELGTADKGIVNSQAKTISRLDATGAVTEELSYKKFGHYLVVEDSENTVWVKATEAYKTSERHQMVTEKQSNY